MYDPILLNRGKQALTQQSNGIEERFLLVDGGHWQTWQPTTSVLVVTFLVQNRMAWIELAASRMIDETTIYKKMRGHWIHIWESIDVLIAMIWQCLDFTIYMYVEKRGTLRYKNKLSLFNYSFLDPHRTNLLWHNNQPTYRSNIWWLFCVENHFIKCYVVICCFCTYKIRWTKLRCWSWYITCMIVWLLYTIRIYSNDSKEEINMIINTYIYVITILFNCSHHVHVIFKNPSRY